MYYLFIGLHTILYSVSANEINVYLAAHFGYNRLNSLVFWMHRSFGILKKFFRVLIGRRKKEETDS